MGDILFAVFFILFAVSLVTFVIAKGNYNASRSPVAYKISIIALCTLLVAFLFLLGTVT